MPYELGYGAQAKRTDVTEHIKNYGYEVGTL